MASPCIDAGSDTAVNLGMDDKTTRTDEVTDTGIVDIGWHYCLPPYVAPTANFSGSPTSGTFVCGYGFDVQFTDTSTGDVSSWLWDFGDGETSTEQNPTHRYSSAGTYTVTLTATGPAGSDSEIKVDYIVIDTRLNVTPHFCLPYYSG